MFGVNSSVQNVAVVLVLGVAVACRITPHVTASAQIAGWVAENSGREQFTLSEIQDLPAWTALYVFRPYTPTTRMQEKLGFDWKDAGRFGLDQRDGIHLAVFVFGTNVVRVEEWERS